MPNRIEAAKNILMLEEGWRSKPYYCSEGYPTWGWGFKIGEKGDPLPAKEITHAEGDPLLEDKVKYLDADLMCTTETSKAYDTCNDVRKAIMISMAYQLGIAGLCKFKNTLKAIERAEWMLAGDMMLDSLAARQTPERWQRAARIMRAGAIK